MTDLNTAAKFRGVAGTFDHLDDAQEVYNALLEAGISSEKLSLTSQSLDVEAPIQQTQAGKSALGGAIAGSLFGVIVCLFWSLLQADEPALSSAGPDFPPLLAIGVGGVVGSAAGGLIGAITGSFTLKPNAQTPSNQHRRTHSVLLEGTPEEVQQALAILEQRAS